MRHLTALTQAAVTDLTSMRVLADAHEEIGQERQAGHWRDLANALTDHFAELPVPGVRPFVVHRHRFDMKPTTSGTSLAPPAILSVEADHMAWRAYWLTAARELQRAPAGMDWYLPVPGGMEVWDTGSHGTYWHHLYGAAYLATAQDRAELSGCNAATLEDMLHDLRQEARNRGLPPGTRVKVYRTGHRHLAMLYYWTGVRWEGSGPHRVNGGGHHEDLP